MEGGREEGREGGNSTPEVTVHNQEQAKCSARHGPLFLSFSKDEDFLEEGLF